MPASNVVSNAGQELWRELTTNSEINAELARLVQKKRGVHPVFIQALTNDGNNLPWEALFETKREFLARNSMWPIGRLAENPHRFRRSLDGSKAYPTLRILAVLSADDVSARSEWDELYDVRNDAAQQGPPRLIVCLDVIVSDEQLRDDINGLGEPASEVRAHMLVDEDTIFDRIKEGEPHIIHFFCHGSAEDDPQLELATISSLEGTGPPVVITPLSLLNKLNTQCLSNVWQVVLNCCDSGKSTQGGGSFAQQLAGDHAPVAIGMWNPIDADEAHAFCRSYYTGVINKLHSILPLSPGASVEVEWVELLCDPRASIQESAHTSQGRIR